MTKEKDFFSLSETWYQSPQGALALDCALHLTKNTLSPWHRRGHRFLQMGFDHAKILELLWQSGFDVSAVCSSPALLLSLDNVLRQCVDIQYRAVASFDHLPYGDKSFDYVGIALPPVLTDSKSSPMPPLEDIISEALRIAAKGIIFQSYNRHSLTGLQLFWQKKSLPPYLQACPWHTWRKVYTLLRRLAPSKAQNKILSKGTRSRATICTKSVLPSPIQYWHNASRLQKTHGLALPLPVGALMQMRLTLEDQGAMTSMPLYVTPLQSKSMHAASAVERVAERAAKNTQKK